MLPKPIFDLAIPVYSFKIISPDLSLKLFFTFFMLFGATLSPLLGQVPDSESASEDHLKAGFSSSFTASDGKPPLWMWANAYGLPDPQASFQQLNRAWIEAPLLSGDGRWQLTTGGELAMRTGTRSNSLHFQRLFARLEYMGFRLSLGRFHDTRGLYMQPLTMGSMTLSRNATPVPKLMFSTDGFVDIPTTNGLLQAQLKYSDGILEDNRSITSPYLHQKSLHLKLNTRTIDVIVGLDHNTMWGGERRDGLPRPPQSFTDYLRIVFSQSGDPESTAIGSEVINRLGNTIASYELGFNYKSNAFTVKTYRSFFIEDRPAMRFRSPWDGVWGIGLKRNDDNEKHVIRTVLYEHLNAIRQDAIGHVPEGRADYYNHTTIYKTGWAYYGSPLGNPLFTYNRDIQRFSNNIILAHHLGINGFLSNSIRYIAIGTYSRNYGLCSDRINRDTCVGLRVTEPLPNGLEELPRGDFRQDRYSFLFSVEYELRTFYNIIFQTATFLDFGKYQSSRFGANIGVTWKF